MNQIIWPVSVKAILWKGKSILFLRNPRGEWELPGGRPEPGEDEQQALIREVKEECGLDVIYADQIGQKIFEIIPGKCVDIRFFDCKFVESALKLSDEHTGAKWISLSESRPLDLPEFYWSVCTNLLKLKHMEI